MSAYSLSKRRLSPSPILLSFQCVSVKPDKLQNLEFPADCSSFASNRYSSIHNYSWTVKKMQISNYNVAWTNRALYLSNRCGYYIIAMVVFYCLLPNIRARHNIKKRSLYIAESTQNGILQKIRIIMFVFMFQYIFYCFYIYFLQDDDVFICLDFRSTTCFTVYVIFLRVHLCHLFIHGNNVLDLTKF